MSETTTTPNSTIIRGFIEEWSTPYYPLFATYLKRGYRELHFEAPYYWSVINIAELTIFGLTEGDTYYEKFNTIESLLTEVQRIQKWHIEMGHDSGIGEMPFVITDIKTAIANNKEIKSILEQLTALLKAGDFYSIPADEHKKRLVELGTTKIQLIKGTIVLVRNT